MTRPVLREYHPDDEVAARAMYQAAFPASLRAPWSEIAGHRDDEQLLVLHDGDGSRIGLTLIRHLGDTGIAFVRYLAIDADRRGRGLGALLVTLLRDRLREDGVGVLLLDVEVPLGEHAEDDRRRIAFYLRCGLDLLDVPGYAPPDHGETGEVVPLVLMGEVLDGGPTLAGDRLLEAANAVLRHRYGVGD